MDIIGIFCWLIYLCCGLVGYFRLKRVTNPVSLFCGLLVLSSMAVLWLPPTSVLNVTVLCVHAISSLLLLALVLCIPSDNWKVVKAPDNCQRVINISSGVIILCAGLNIVVILQLGGLQEYLWSLPTRSVSHDEIRVLKLITRLTLPAWIVLFAALVTCQQLKGAGLKLLTMTLLMLSVQVSQGGRSAVILPLLAALIIWEDCRRPLRPSTGLLVVTVFTGFLAVSEVFRRSFDLEAFGAEGQYASWRFADYVSFAARLIGDNLDFQLALGETYLAAVTNFIPRTVWGHKPQGGGAYLDDVVLGDLWTTATITPGNVIESILNFGLYIGPALSIVILMSICTFTVGLKMAPWRRRVGRTEGMSVFKEAKYISLLFFLIGQPVAEFANAFANFIMMLAMIAAIETTSRIKIRFDREQLWR